MANRNWTSSCLALVAAGLLVIATSVAALFASGGTRDQRRPIPIAMTQAQNSIDARFAVLVSARTNRCDLGAMGLRRMPDENCSRALVAYLWTATDHSRPGPSGHPTLHPRRYLPTGYYTR